MWSVVFQYGFEPVLCVVHNDFGYPFCILVKFWHGLNMFWAVSGLCGDVHARLLYVLLEWRSR